MISSVVNVVLNLDKLDSQCPECNNTINLTGKWYIEEVSEHVEYNSPRDLLGFIKKHFKGLILLPIGSYAILFIIFDLLGWYSFNVFSLINGIGDPIILIYLIFIPYLITLSYFVTVWTWEDGEIKIMEFSKDKSGERIINNLWTASSSLDNIFSILIIGIAISWIKKLELFALPANLDQSVTQIVLNFLYMIVFLVGPTLFTGLMYYASPMHVDLVNHLRSRILEKYQYESTDKIVCPQCRGNKKHKQFINSGVSISMSRIVAFNKE